MIDVAHREVHVHLGPGPGGYAWKTVRSASERLEPDERRANWPSPLEELEHL